MIPTEKLDKCDTLIKVDLDGVLRNWNASLIRAFKEQYPDENVVYPFADFKIDPSFPPWFNSRKFYLEEQPYDIYRNAKPYDGAREFIDSLLLEFPHVWLVTTQYPLTMYPTIRWIEDHMPATDLPIVFSDKKGFIGRSLFDNRILIDDAPHNLMNEVDEHGIPLCFGQSYNFNKAGHHQWYNFFGDTDFSEEAEPKRVSAQFQMILDYLRYWVV
jgi:5'(3')-deoxyribonucleotidase